MALISREHAAADLVSGTVVFLVALPLCLGVALASGAPLISGVIAGVVGGMVVTLVSRSELGVSGPAAGLTVVVLAAIQDLGFSAFLHKASVMRDLSSLPDGSTVTIDGSRCVLADHDVREVISEFVRSAPGRGIEVRLENLDRVKILGSERPAV